MKKIAFLLLGLFAATTTAIDLYDGMKGNVIPLNEVTFKKQLQMARKKSVATIHFYRSNGDISYHLQSPLTKSRRILQELR